MDGFVQPEPSLCQAGRGQHSYGAGNHAGFIGQDITEHVGGNNHIELFRVPHQLHCGIVHVHMLKGHVGIIPGNLCDHFPPQPRAFQDICLVDTGNLSASLSCDFKSYPGDALNLADAVGLGVVGLLAHFSRAPPPLSEIDAAGKLPYHHDIHALADDIRTQGACVTQFLVEYGRAQVSEEPEASPEPQKTGFRPFIPRKAVPFRASHRSQKNRVAFHAFVKGFLGQWGSGGVNGASACQQLPEPETMAEPPANLLQHQQRLFCYFRAYAIARQYSNPVFHTNLLFA